MNIEKLEIAVEEAERFLEKCKKLGVRIAEERRHKEIYKYSLNPFSGCIESGAVRRSSMDLSRALADLRKPE